MASRYPHCRLNERGEVIECLISGVPFLRPLNHPDQFNCMRGVLPRVQPIGVRKCYTCSMNNQSCEPHDYISENYHRIGDNYKPDSLSSSEHPTVIKLRMPTPKKDPGSTVQILRRKQIPSQPQQ